MISRLIYGVLPVPFSVAWSEENRYWIAPCAYANGMPSLHQQEQQGVGKPTFSKPHSQRQRRAIAMGLCDVCHRSLSVRTKISLSFDRLTDVGGIAMPLVVEPLCCRECAQLSVRNCPHLKRHAADGTVRIRKVLKYQIVAQQLTGDATFEFAGEYRPGTVGHLKMQLQRYTDVSLDWLLG